MAKTSGIDPQHILQVAEAIIAAKGIKDTSLKDIAKAVGISTGTLYYHYATKEALIYDITKRHFDNVTQRTIKLIEDIRGRMSREEIVRVVLEGLAGQKEMDRLHLYVLHEAISGNVDLLGRYSERYREWRDVFRATLGKIYGEEHPMHDAAADILLCLIEGCTTRRMVLDEPIDYLSMARCINGLYAKIREEEP